MNMHRLERIALVGIKEKPKAFITKNNRHITHTDNVTRIALETKLVGIILADYGIAQTAAWGDHAIHDRHLTTKLSS